MSDAGPAVAVRLTDDAARALPFSLAAMVRDVGPGATAVVDVTHARPAPAELGLVLTVLWRRVGPTGQVRLTGAPEFRLRSWERLGLDPEAVRAAVHGPPAVPPAPTAAVPLQRAAVDPEAAATPAGR